MYSMRAPLAQTPRLRDLMRTDLVVATPTTPVGEAYRLLAQTGVRYLPVMEGGRYQGMVGERSLRPLLAPWARVSWEAPLGRFLQAFPEAHPEEGLEEAAFLLETAWVGALPVVEEGALVGLVTAYDLLKGLLDRLRPALPASRLEVLIPDLSYLKGLLEALEVTRVPLVGLHLFREAGKLGFRALLYLGALDLRPLLERLESLGLKPFRT